MTAPRTPEDARYRPVPGDVRIADGRYYVLVRRDDGALVIRPEQSIGLGDRRFTPKVWARDDGDDVSGPVRWAPCEPDFDEPRDAIDARWYPIVGDKCVTAWDTFTVEHLLPGYRMVVACSGYGRDNTSEVWTYERWASVGYGPSWVPS